MCGRYYLGTEDDRYWLERLISEVAEHYQGTPAMASMRLGEIFPANIVPTIAGDGARLMKWGYAGYGNRVINARSETAFEKPMFRTSLLTRRCLIPASGYYEWQRNTSGGKTKQKYAFYRPGQPMYMAGLWREEKGEALPVFVILTRQAAPDIAGIHDRMPVILPDELLYGWVANGDAEYILARAIQDVQCKAVAS